MSDAQLPRPSSFVVTGGGSGIGLAITRTLATRGAVVVIDLEPGGFKEVGSGASAFRDASLTDASAAEIGTLIGLNLGLALTGCHVAVNHFRQHGRRGSIVNVTSHQAQRPVRGALPYATAKAAVEGLTRAVAVDHGPDGIRANAVALGSIATERYAQLLRKHPSVEDVMASLHPLGRVGTTNEVADVVAFLLSDQAGFISGATIPVDGGRAALGADPESRD